MTAFASERIGPEQWQILGGIRGGSSPGPKPVDERSNNPCDDCGKALHAHQKRRVFPEKGPAGSSHHKLECPE